MAGSCFCCNFNALTETVESLSASQRPDIILAEPVGSCTDLVATVIRPLERVYAQPFDIAPFGVIIKPSHGIKILSGAGQKGFSPKAEYIFRKQIEEADFVILNRIDELSETEAKSLCDLLAKEYSDIPILRTSAKTGQGMEALVAYLDQQGVFGTRAMEVDYDIYAEGEAELGWLNCQVALNSVDALDLDAFLMSSLARLHQAFVQKGEEVAHLKAIGMADGVYAVANLVSNSDRPVLSLPSRWQGNQADLVYNARVATSPSVLEATVTQAIQEEAGQSNCSARVKALQCFRPGRPVPTHHLPAK